jgi:acetyl-CoA carboxylase biotin carboxyl carrier protein
MSFSSSFSLPTVRAIAQLLDEAQLSEITIETGDESAPQRLVVRREVTIAPGHKTEAPVETVEGTAKETPATPAESSRILVVSPTVGYFHHNEKPFGEGAVVRAGQTIAIVKTLAIPNDVTASVDGRVLEVLAAEGQGVAFGQPLFVIEKES